MRRRQATWLLVLALTAPVSAPASEFDAMIAMMFRMMVSAMQTMANAMDNDDWYGNPWTTAWPVSGAGWPGSGLGMSPWSGMGMSPWSGMGMSPWSGMGMSPWSGIGPGTPGGFGGTPWSSFDTSPWGGGGLPDSLPYRYPGGAGWPGGRGPHAVTAPGSLSLLDGRWYGNTGEILEIRGNRFRLRNARATLRGTAVIDNNLLKLYTPQTNTMTVYSFVRNQTDLVLQEPNGDTLVFRQHPAAAVSPPLIRF